MPCKNPDLAASGTGSVPVAAVPERSGSSLGSLPVPRELQVQVRFAARLPPRPVNRPGTRGPRHWGGSLPLAVLNEKPPRAASTRGSRTGRDGPVLPSRPGHRPTLAGDSLADSDDASGVPSGSPKLRYGSLALRLARPWTLAE